MYSALAVAAGTRPNPGRKAVRIRPRSGRDPAGWDPIALYFRPAGRVMDFLFGLPLTFHNVLTFHFVVGLYKREVLLSSKGAVEQVS